MALAILTVVTVFVGWSRYLIFDRQLTEMRLNRTGGDDAFKLQIGAMREQAAAMQGQATAMKAQADTSREILLAGDRPWLRAVGLEVESLAIGGGEVSVRANLMARNVGHSPALDVHIVAVLEPSLTGDEEASEARRICGEAKARTRVFYDSVVFPGEDRTYRPNETLFETDVASIRRHREAMVKAEWAQRRDLMGKDAADAWTKRQMDLPLRDELTLLGCATYRAPAGGEVHATGFGLDLGRACGESPVGRRTFDFSGPPDYPRSRLVGTGLLGAGYAD